MMASLLFNPLVSIFFPALKNSKVEKENVFLPTN
jgi:hypothetical protein